MYEVILNIAHQPGVCFLYAIFPFFSYPIITKADKCQKLCIFIVKYSKKCQNVKYKCLVHSKDMCQVYASHTQVGYVHY